MDERWDWIGVWFKGSFEAAFFMTYMCVMKRAL